ncbi:hypothetical protein MKW92_003148 [Papaver armeniacum]|nr:hypothetical protein MKW92_003148 [Papaver armeniacum]
MEFNGIVQSLENKIILVTGSTGYLSKLFVEKLLRVQPNIKHLFLLLRYAGASSPTERLHKDVTGKEVFRVLREKHGLGFESFISQKVTPIFGDISLKNLGINDSDLEKKMHKEIHFVVNFAATTTFDERYSLTNSFGAGIISVDVVLTLFCYLILIRYDVALAVNTMGAKHILDFAEKCENLEMCMHLSTDRLDELKAKQVSKKQETASMKELGFERAKLYGFSNTYVFTKAMGEIIIGRYLKRNFPVVIVRPTAVTSTYREPFPGWIEGFKSIDPLVIGVGRGKLPCFLGAHESFFDIIPGDMVVNTIIVAIVYHAQTKNHVLSRDDDVIIYHIGNSTHRKPTRIVQLLEYAYEYFCENPWMGRDADKIVRPVFFPTMSDFREHIHNNYVVPMKEQKVQFAKRLAEVYGPYLLFKITFDTSATDLLRIWMKACYGDGEADIFDFDPKHINWKDYMMNIHIPGLMNYVVKPHVGYNSKL